MAEPADCERSREWLSRVVDRAGGMRGAPLRTMRDSLDRSRSGNGYTISMEHLKRVEKMMPGARTFVVLDAKGLCQLSNRPELVGQVFSQRESVCAGTGLRP